MAVSIEEFERALLRLEEALAQPKNDFIRDSVIQRFEFSIELAWKSAKKQLGLTDTAPKMIIRDLAQQGLISDPLRWFGFLEARNLSSHSYNEGVAEQIYSTAKEALPDLKAFAERLRRI